jgi:YggT family protein
VLNYLAFLIRQLANIFIWIVIIDIILHYFMDPYHPIRRTLDNIVEPFLAPIRRVVPLIGMFDFSPLVLIILVQVLSSVLISFLNILR